MGAQIRLDDEVAAALIAKATGPDGSQRSLSAEANAWLRRALGLEPGSRSPAALRAMANHPHPGSGPASISAPQARPISQTSWQGPRSRAQGR